MAVKPMLVLWDIDHTLIDGGPAGGAACAAAFHRATGRQMERPWRFDGRTELSAARDALLAHGLLPHADLVARMLDHLVAELSARAGELAANGRALPGASEALTAVRAVGGVHQSVLTGNLYPLAKLKLATFGLDPHLDLRIGAFGGDALERTTCQRTPSIAPSAASAAGSPALRPSSSATLPVTSTQPKPSAQRPSAFRPVPRPLRNCGQQARMSSSPTFPTSTRSWTPCSVNDEPSCSPGRPRTVMRAHTRCRPNRLQTSTLMYITEPGWTIRSRVRR